MAKTCVKDIIRRENTRTHYLGWRLLS